MPLLRGLSLIPPPSISTAYAEKVPAGVALRVSWISYFSMVYRLFGTAEIKNNWGQFRGLYYRAKRGNRPAHLLPNQTAITVFIYSIWRDAPSPAPNRRQTV